MNKEYVQSMLSQVTKDTVFHTPENKIRANYLLELLEYNKDEKFQARVLERVAEIVLRDTEDFLFSCSEPTPTKKSCGCSQC